jgi:hypothetical protein
LFLELFLDVLGLGFGYAVFDGLWRAVDQILRFL